MSDLQKRLTKAAVESLGEHVYEASAAHATIQEAYWPIIEAELQKRDRLRHQINDAYVRTEASLTEANKQLEELRDQGCEFCEAAIDDRITDEPEFMGNFKHSWICGRCWNDQGRKLTETNKLLEQTIEVLEGLATAIDFYFVHEDGEGERRSRELYEARQSAHALLDNLKALTKEGTE